jgi:anaerobic dimethyl sulfoxide reductase subunit B (iron-sulfur subunit)
MGGVLMPASEKEYLIDFDAEKCTQCHGCEIACKAWRELRYGIQYRRVLNLWKGEYPNVKNASLSLACLHCVEPACAVACPENAISKRVEDGLVVVDETLCTGCEICAEACAFGVPQFGDNGVMQKCDFCRDQQLAGASPPCVDTCPGEALSFIEISPSEKAVHEEKIRQLLGSGSSRAADA